jgi:rhamnosyltransferase
MSFAVIVPTLNAGIQWSAWIAAINAQSIKPEDVLVIDSGSKDETVSLSQQAGFQVHVLHPGEFSHGGTRKQAVVRNQHHEFVVFLTQDAILANSDAFRNILLPFENSGVAAVCGRQLPSSGAGAIGAHARLFNYPATSFVRTYDDRKTYGLKAAFLSNSFAAYRVNVLVELGSFPEDVIFGEDMYAAVKMLQAGYKIAYAADACVYHSHDYSLRQEFRRYFDMGVFHAREPWIRKEFGGAEGEGARFVGSELKYLLKHAFWRVPEGLLRTVFRYAGFRLGLVENMLPLILKRKLSMNRGYFK